MMKRRGESVVDPIQILICLWMMITMYEKLAKAILKQAIIC